ncbi:transmembrane protein, putative, partial (macronuclear) [Tetrahymena thermophila SB210]
MMDVIIFADKINDCKEKLRKVLLQIGNFYDFLSGDFINLQQLQEMYAPILNQKEDLEQTFIELFQINPYDSDLEFLAYIFISIFGFQNRSIKEFQDAAQNLNQQKNNKYKKLNLINQQSEKISVIFTSLIEKKYVIKQTSKLFQNMFGYSSEFIHGKELNTLIPNMLKKHHDQIIQHFVDDEQMAIINLGNRNIFGLDNEEFVFPIDLRIKIEAFENDFGVCALIQKKKQYFSYIFFENEGKITDFSRKIFLDIFQPLGYKNGSQLNIFDLIPTLEDLFQTQQLNQHLNSVLVIKKPQSDKSQTLLSESLYQSLKTNNNSNMFCQNNQVFHIQFRLLSHSIKNKININLIEIDFYSQITDYVQKNLIFEQLNRLKEMKESLNQEKIQLQQNANFTNSQFFSSKEFSQIFENQDFNAFKNKEYEKNSLRSYQQQQFQNDSVEQKLSLHQNSNGSCDSQNLKNYQQQHNEKRQLNQNGNYFNYDQQLLTQNQSYKISTNAVEQVETILSPSVISLDRLQIQINQTNQQRHFTFLPNKTKQIHIIEPIASNKISSYQSKDNLENIQNNSPNKINQSDNQSSHSSSNLTSNINWREKEQFQQNKQNEISSINSSSKHSAEQMMKRKMIKRVKKNEFTFGLKLMAFTGIAAFLILIIVSFVIYIQNLQNLNSFAKSFLEIDDALFCFIDPLNFISLYRYGTILEKNKYLIIDSNDLQKYESSQINYQQYLLIQDYKLKLERLILTNNNDEQLDELQKNQFKVHIKRAKDENYIQQKNNFFTYETSLQAALKQLLQQIVFYYLNYEDSQEDFIWGNIINFKQKMKDLQLIVENHAQNKFEIMDYYQIFTIMLFSTISSLLILSILPLNCIIQVQKQNILKLFGTFSPSVIESKIKQIEINLQKTDQMKILENQTCDNKAQIKNRNSIKQKQIQQVRDLCLYSNIESKEAQLQEIRHHNPAPNQIQRQQNKRKRKIASFSSIPKLNLILLFLGIIVLLLLLVIPIINLIAFDPFEKESQHTLKVKISLIDIFSLIIQNFSSHMEQVFLISKQLHPQKSLQYEYLSIIQSQNQNYNQYIQNLVVEVGITINDQAMYKNFYLNLLKQNVCDVRKNYPQYFNSNITE